MRIFSKHFTVLLITIITSLFLFATCTSGVNKSSNRGDELDMFIREVSDYLNNQIPQGNKVAVVSADRNLPALSEYVIDGIMENAVNDRVFTVVDRAQLNAIRSELEFQMSGEVSDETIQSVGRMLGANTIVTVVSAKIGNQYRFRIRALNVESAAILGMMNRNVSDSPMINALVRSQLPQSRPAATTNQTTSTNQAATTAPSSSPRTQTTSTSSTTNRTTTTAQTPANDHQLATIRIAGKHWMRRNLNIQTDDSWCYENNPNNCARYGRLYTWDAALMACASLGNEWRLPTAAEWRALFAAANPRGGVHFSYALRARSDLWGHNGVNHPNWETNSNINKLGFAGLPGGQRSVSPLYRTPWQEIGRRAYWWTATEDNNRDNHAHYYGINEMSTFTGISPKPTGLSVRCVRD